MKLLDNKKENIILSLHTNSTGDIIQGNEKISGLVTDSKINKLEDILTKKSILELSMNTGGIIHIETNIAGYSHGMALKTGKGFSVRQEIVLFSDKYASDHLNSIGGDKEKNIISDIKDKSRIISTDLILSSVETFKGDYPDIPVNVNCDEDIMIEGCFAKLKILILSMIALMLEVDFEGELNIGTRNRNGNCEIVLSVFAKEMKMLSGIVDFCNSYPFSSTTAVYTRALCNEMKVELNVFQELDYVEMYISLAQSNDSTYSVYAEDTFKYREIYNLCMSLFFNKR